MEYSGLLSNERPMERNGPISKSGETVIIGRGGRAFFARVRWKRMGSANELVLMNSQGKVVAQSQSEGTYREQSKSRALYVKRLPPGRYALKIESLRATDPDAMRHATWRIKATGDWNLRGILDQPSAVRVCVSMVRPPTEN